MNVYIPVHVGFDRNKKTVKLKLLLNDKQADCWPQRLWRWVAVEFPNGKPDLALVEKACEWEGAAGVLLEAFRESDFISRATGEIPNWPERAPFFAALAAESDSGATERNGGATERNGARNENATKKPLTSAERSRRWRERHKPPEPIGEPSCDSATERNGKNSRCVARNENATERNGGATKTQRNLVENIPSGTQSTRGPASKFNPNVKESMHACSAQQTLAGIPPVDPAKPKRQRKAKPESEYTEADYALIRSFREDWEDTLDKPGRMRGKPITDRELKAAKGFRDEQWTDDQLLAQKKLFLHDKPRPARFLGDRDWPGWKRKILSVHDWFRFRNQLENQITGRDLDRSDH